MKIAYIVGLFPRLYNTFTLNDIIQLIDQGHDVSIFAINRSNETVINEGVYRVRESTYYIDDFVVNRRSRLASRLLNFSKHRKMPKGLARAIGDFLFKPQSERTIIDKYFRDFGWKLYAFRTIAEKIRNEQVDIIHGAFGSNEATAAMILSGLTRIPFTFETHAKDLFVGFRHAKEKIRTAKKIVTISHYNKRYLMEHCKCPEAKILVKRVLFNRDHCDRISTASRKDNLMLSVCRLETIKGLKYAIEAFNLIATKWGGLRYSIVGEGLLRSTLMKQVEQLSLTDKITFLGNISNEDALDLIAQATIVVLPSVIAPNGDRDGIPTSLIEAMYLKTPVIASRVSGIPELIDDGLNGFLTEPGNVGQIAEKVNDLLSNKMLRSKSGEEARKKIECEFNREENSAKLIAAWAEIVG